ncbi:flagellar motor protein MotB [Pseudacidovorax intermedius]|uniref:flagellar motor protein MotB n=1 Tax=Pseudacidovorax intermedius TaxID=433924 RepID=UPI0009E9151A|nr:flagellar motor protein MotB [Pseudacidovorax intermedius]
MATGSSGRKLQPIIVKRVKKVVHANHGGAWKIAYADFVTAMMAFFLLMWLLGSTTKGDLQGIAMYFNSPLKVEMAGGPGTGSSTSIVTGGGNDLTRATGELRRSTDGGKEKGRPSIESTKKAQAAKEDAKRLEVLRGKIEVMITSDVRLREFRSQIRLETTPDGLEIQIVDAQQRAMFDTGSALVKPYMRDILSAIGSSLKGIENKVSLAGHTDSTPYGNGERGYSNWELSADRANASRRELVAAGMPEDKLIRVVGLAASDPLDKAERTAPVNRRISITVLTREAEARMDGRKSVDAADAVKAMKEHGSAAPAQEAAAGEAEAEAEPAARPAPAKPALAKPVAAEPPAAAPPAPRKL